jgi:hypothetical protein
LTVAPCLWYQHLLKALKEMGFTQCAQNPCLLFKKNMLLITYVDDVGVAAPTSALIDDFVADLKSRGFSFDKRYPLALDIV